MPSSEHAILVELFRARPSLATALLRLGGLRIAGGLTAEISESTFPVSMADTHADAVVLLRGAEAKLRLVVVVEVQLAIDGDKPHRWLTYHVAAEQRYASTAVVLVVAPDARVARWARKPHPVGPRGSFAPLVLGPDEVPRIADLADDERSVELTVLSLLAHRDADRATLRAATVALAAEESDRASLYFDLLLATFGQALTRAVEDLMVNGEPLSEWAKAHYRQGKEEGKTEGKAEGKLEGEAAGKAAGKAESVLAILSARGLTFSPDERRAIVGRTDLELLDRWIARALTVRSVAELLAES
jgi:predicted transposase YdaD